MAKAVKLRQLADTYLVPGFRPLQRLQVLFGEPGAPYHSRAAGKETICGIRCTGHRTWYDRRRPRVWPVWHLLEKHLTLVLPNAQHIRNVPGRKTGVNDAAWIANLLAHGLIRSSFVPPAPIQGAV